MAETLPLDAVTFYLTDLNQALVDAWRGAFADCPRVHAERAGLFDRQVDALVSPANSFGFMDGGLDLKISERFGWALEGRVRQRLLDEHDGELPVGQAILAPTEDDHIPWLISAPTMRVPMRVDTTANAYLAFRAILRLVRAHNLAHPDTPLRTISCPGLGTGEGRMPPHLCARQMRRAYDACALGRPLTRGGLAAAARDHMDLVGYEE